MGDIRDEKVRVLRGMPSIEPKNVIIGQYEKSLDSTKPGYKEDDTVPKESRCPTFAAMVAYIKNERWDGVPFILKAGDRDPCAVQGCHIGHLQGYPTKRARHSGAAKRVCLRQDE